MDIKDIDKSMPLHDFPETYNSNNKTLVDTINTLQQKLDDAEKQHNIDISNLRSMYNDAINNIKKEFDAKMTEFEKKFVNIDGFEDSVKQIINNQTGK